MVNIYHKLIITKNRLKGDQLLALGMSLSNGVAPPAGGVEDVGTAFRRTADY